MLNDRPTFYTVGKCKSPKGVLLIGYNFQVALEVVQSPDITMAIITPSLPLTSHHQIPIAHCSRYCSWRLRAMSMDLAERSWKMARGQTTTIVDQMSSSACTWTWTKFSPYMNGTDGPESAYHKGTGVMVDMIAKMEVTRSSASYICRESGLSGKWESKGKNLVRLQRDIDHVIMCTTISLNLGKLWAVLRNLRLPPFQ